MFDCKIREKWLDSRHKNNYDFKTKIPETIKGNIFTKLGFVAAVKSLIGRKLNMVVLSIGPSCFKTLALFVYWSSTMHCPQLNCYLASTASFETEFYKKYTATLLNSVCPNTYNNWKTISFLRSRLFWMSSRIGLRGGKRCVTTLITNGWKGD